ncbi:MAG: helix-turn-helix transcriptional regulator [Lachnospiraceae bacterium]|nr:helix-turn-helix transcriptional regulator [Lachnospiraceae bacterium]
MDSKCNRLREVREAKNLTRKEVCWKLDNFITERTLKRYEGDALRAPGYVLVMLAGLYNVSVDYLLGRSDERSRDAEIAGAAKTLGLCDEAAETIARLTHAPGGKELVNAALLEFEPLEKILKKANELVFLTRRKSGEFPNLEMDDETHNRINRKRLDAVSTLRALGCEVVDRDANLRNKREELTEAIFELVSKIVEKGAE